MGQARPPQAAVIEAVYRTVSDPASWPDALALLSDHIGAAGGMLIYHPPGRTGDVLLTARLREDLKELYFRHYVPNPHILAFARVPAGRPYFANEIVDVAALSRTPYHADIIAAQGIADMVVLNHQALSRGGGAGGLSFKLSSGQAPDRATVASRLDPIAPHVSRAVDLAIALDGQDQAGRLLDALPGPALLIDGRGRLVRANAAAESLLAAADGLMIDKGEVPQLLAGLPSEARALAKALSGAVSVANGLDAPVRAALRLTRPSGRPALIVVVTPLPPPSFSLWGRVEAGARALVQITDPDAPAGAQAAILREAAGLTATEARIVALVGEGRPTPEVARMLGLSPNTVRTHLARCFDKTGARSQVALARLLTSLSG